MAKEKLTLLQKLAKIREMSDAFVKNKSGYKYTYTELSEILAKITAGMKKYEVSLIPCIVPGTSDVSQNITVNTKIDKQGKAYDSTTTEMLFRAEMTFKWIDNEDPTDVIEVPWYLVSSMPDPAQAMGSGLTYCTRYFMLNYFQIAQVDNDVDAYRTKQKEAEVAEEKAIADAVIAKFDVALKQYLSDNQDKVGEIKEFCSKYIKGGNYLKINEPVLAKKLMDDFTKKYLEAKPAEKKENKETDKKEKSK